MTQALYRNLMPLFVTSGLAGVVLAILAPLGTDSFTVLGRLAYWVGLCMAGGIGAGLADWFLRRIRPGLSIWPNTLGQSIGATALVAVFVFAMTPTTNPKHIALTLFYIWVVAMTISGVGALLSQARASKQSGLDMSARPRLFERIAPKLRGAELYALMSEDHYVRVMTSAGEDMILMRLSDAIRDTEPLPGVKIHRSWWVAEAGITDIRREDGKYRANLKNGQTAPISRSGIALVKQAGWV